MLVSNYTFNISKECVSSWETFWSILLRYEWQKDENICELKTFYLVTEVENDGKTYAIQTYFESEAKLLSFHAYFDSYLLPLIHGQFAGQYVYFQTTLSSWD